MQKLVCLPNGRTLGLGAGEVETNVLCDKKPVKSQPGQFMPTGRRPGIQGLSSLLRSHLSSPSSPKFMAIIIISTYKLVHKKILPSSPKPPNLTLSCRWSIYRPPSFPSSSSCKNIQKHPKYFIFSPENQGGLW